MKRTLFGLVVLAISILSIAPTASAQSRRDNDGRRDGRQAVQRNYDRDDRRGRVDNNRRYDDNRRNDNWRNDNWRRHDNRGWPNGYDSRWNYQGGQFRPNNAYAWWYDGYGYDWGYNGWSSGYDWRGYHSVWSDYDGYDTYGQVIIVPRRRVNVRRYYDPRISGYFYFDNFGVRINIR